MSFRKIDYRVRPAKSVERKMMVEAFRRLSEFGELSAFQYVGFGSLFFSDFSIFHRSLGLDQMVSIENTSDPVVKDRFKFNVPYGHIDLRYGHSNSELRKLNWRMRSIVWMDYDGTISQAVLRDVNFLATNVTQGSAIVFSINAAGVPALDAEEERDSEKLSLVDRLKAILGSDAVPYSLKSSDLSGWGVARAYREIINAEIEKALLVRNSTLPAGAHLHYRQIFNFHYSDNAKMLTVGGIIYDAGQKPALAKCAFDFLPFAKSEAEPFLIETPNLTFKEMRELDSKFPSAPISLPIPISEIERYKKTYRFFPKFVEAEVS